MLAIRIAGRRMQHGPFSRRETPTQTPADAVEQCRSGEIWGSIPKWSQWPTVQAYGGRLKNGGRGIEFTTDINSHPSGSLDRNSPFELRWYLGLTPGVLKREKNNQEFACIVADVDNHQP